MTESWAESISCQERNTHSGRAQAGGRSLGKVTNSHTPLLQRCQKSLISLCLRKHSLSGPERKVVTSPAVFWIAPVLRAAPERCHCWNSAALAFYSENLVLHERTSPEEWLMSVNRIRDVDEWTPLAHLNCVSWESVKHRDWDFISPWLD